MNSPRLDSPAPIICSGMPSLSISIAIIEVGIDHGSRKVDETVETLVALIVWIVIFPLIVWLLPSEMPVTGVSISISPSLL